MLFHLCPQLAIAIHSPTRERGTTGRWNHEGHEDHEGFGIILNHGFPQEVDTPTESLVEPLVFVDFAAFNPLLQSNQHSSLHDVMTNGHDRIQHRKQDP